jgi:hypothetical protein
MKSLIVLGLVGFALSTAACTADSSSPSEASISSADRLVLDVRCATNADCPATFECELESEHGAPRSFCKSHDTIGSASSPSCPAGTEAEVEHGTTFCKAHGGAAGGGSSSGTGVDDDGGTSKHTGVDDDSGAAKGSSSSGSSGTPGVDDDAGAPSSGSAPAGAACATNADCATGLECDVTSSTCKAHGGKKI